VNGYSSFFHDELPILKNFMTYVEQLGTFGSVASLLAATLYQGNHDRNHKLWHIVSAERYTLYAGAVGMLLHI
jgi:hypothetical protein